MQKQLRKINVGNICRKLRQKYDVSIDEMIKIYGGNKLIYSRFENGTTSTYYPLLGYIDLFGNEIYQLILNEMKEVNYSA